LFFFVGCKSHRRFAQKLVEIRSPLRVVREKIILVLCLWLAACGDSDKVSKLRKLAENGNASAQHNLALLLASGDETRRDYPQAVEWYRKAVAQGVVESAYNLGVIYKSGADRVPRDVGEACRWFDYAAQSGLVSGMYQYAFCLGRTKEAANWLSRAADAGSADALAELGTRIIYGLGLPQDIQKGVSMERRAAEMGSPVGMHNYAVSLANGIGIEKDERAAFYWMSKAASANYCMSYGSLAINYLTGNVVPKNEKKALELIYVGASVGDKNALQMLATIFESGQLGQPKDTVKAATVRAVVPACGI
jgi:TPR repeat protein